MNEQLTKILQYGISRDKRYKEKHKKYEECILISFVSN